MASILTIGNSVRAQIRRVGHPTMAQNFPLKNYESVAEAKKAAEDWVVKQEAAILAGKQSGLSGTRGVTLAEAVNRFLEEKPNTNTSMAYAMRSFAKAPIGKVLLFKLSENDIVRYIQDKEFGPASGAFHFSSFCSVIRRAKIVWKLAFPDILQATRERLSYEGLIGSSTKRTRRPTKEELELLNSYKYFKNFPMAAIINFAVSSAMRCSEITRIRKDDFSEKDKTIIIRDRKHPKKKIGNHKVVPLLDEAVKIIKDQISSHDDELIFPYRKEYISVVWMKACKKLGIVDLHFHDLRHEATSRLFEMGYQPQEVQLYTGHEDLNMLMRYTHLNPKNIRRLESKEEKKEKKDKQKKVTAPEIDPAMMKEFEEFLRFKKMQEMMAAAKAA